jgi:DNA helicase-2/ATP-dependent DNA helicase PcrA
VTSRIGSPDTDADRELRARLDQANSRNFIMVSGAGSGKTTSLVKALAHLQEHRGDMLRRRGQQIACITYTKVAVAEIWGDVGNAPLFHVSTIHSFLWTIVHSFQEDIREWVASRIGEKIADAQEKIDKPRTHEATRVRLRADIARYSNQLAQLQRVPRFTYETGSNYLEGKLGDDDILRIGPAFIEQHELMRSIVAQRFPFVFVDESQDTNPDVVRALKTIAAMPGFDFCLGFFGDPMQKIYLTGVGAIATEEGWALVSKPENFRCPTTVLTVINQIRAEDDRLFQVPGDRVGPDGLQLPRPVGTAKLFLVPAGSDRTARVNQVREWMEVANNDPLWRSDEESADVRMLVLVHRIAATRLGFPDVYASLNDNGSHALKDGLLEGTAWVLRPFMTYLLPLAAAARDGKDFELMSLLRSDSPALAKVRAGGHDVAAVLNLLTIDVGALVAMFAEGNESTIRDVLNFVRDSMRLRRLMIALSRTSTTTQSKTPMTRIPNIVQSLRSLRAELRSCGATTGTSGTFLRLLLSKELRALNFSACSWCLTTRKVTIPSSRTANTGDWNHCPHQTRKISPMAKIRCLIAHAVSFMSAARGLFTISQLCYLSRMCTGHTRWYWRKTSFRLKTYTSSTGRLSDRTQLAHDNASRSAPGPDYFSERQCIFLGTRRLS